MSWVTHEGVGSTAGGEPHDSGCQRKCKAAKTVQPAMAGPLLSLRPSMSRPPARLLLVHRRPEAAPSTHALSPGVAAACGTHVDGGGAAAC